MRSILVYLRIFTNAQEKNMVSGEEKKDGPTQIICSVGSLLTILRAIVSSIVF